MFNNIGQAIRLARHQSGLTQAALANAAGLGMGMLARAEAGKHLPTLDSLRRILVALDIKPMKFFQLLELVDEQRSILG